MKPLLPTPSVKALLTLADLPTTDLDTATALRLFGIEENGRLQGMVGYELHSEHILLRSLAVDPSQRGRGLGRRLVAHAEQMAQRDGATSAWLLTTTAEDFFSANGYSAAGRDSAPDAIRGTSQFSSLCPASSAFMCKRLGG